jgi:hypothetical protein
LVPDIVDFFLDCQLADGSEREAKEQTDAAL